MTTIVPPLATIERMLTPAQIAHAEKTEQDFAAMAIGQLLQPMFDTVDLAAGMFGGGVGKSTWRTTLTQAIAKQIVHQGARGLAQPVLASMLQMQAMRMQKNQARETDQ
jgi:peptidoglycan hydrolase FlgJ